MKTLEKRMTYSEVQQYLEERPNKRLPLIDEYIDTDMEKPYWIDVPIIEEFIGNNIVARIGLVYNPISKKYENSNTLFKHKVIILEREIVK